MINKTNLFPKVQATQKDITLDRPLSITLQQTHENVILIDGASLNEHTVKNKLKQTTDTFMKNLNKISKMRDNIRHKKVKDNVITMRFL